MELYTKSDDTIHQQTVVTQVMNRIKDAIASGHYGPGDHLPSESELAQMYGVGRSSIREAIKVFQHLGVVESRPAKGTVVRERANISAEAITWAVLLGKDDLRDVLDLREAIERASFVRFTDALQRDNDTAREVVDLLGEQVTVMIAAAEARDARRLMEADYRFHGLIIDAGGNELFRALYRSLHAFMSEEIFAAYNEIGELSVATQLHVDIVNALRDMSAEGALQKHQDHFEVTRKLLKIELE